MATARVDLRLDEEIKAKAEKASALLGLKSLTEYVVRLMDEDATRVVAEHEGISIENDLFDRFMQACDEVKKPNNALINAALHAKEQDIK